MQSLMIFETKTIFNLPLSSLIYTFVHEFLKLLTRYFTKLSYYCSLITYLSINNVVIRIKFLQNVMQIIHYFTKAKCLTFENEASEEK